MLSPTQFQKEVSGTVTGNAQVRLLYAPSSTGHMPKDYQVSPSPQLDDKVQDYIAFLIFIFI